MSGVSRQQSHSGRDIGDIPAIENPERRESCRLDLLKDLLTYFPEAFPLPFSQDHIRIIKKIETTVLYGSLQAIGCMRGFGKSTILERAIIWAIKYGHRHFAVLISAEAGLSKQSLDSIESELENNDLLNEDFPEICYPIRCLEGIHQRALGQHSNGERTKIRMTDEEICFPTIQGSVASGAIIRVAGITGRIRGMKAPGPAGTVLRPDLALIDDPQTDESAKSVTQCEQRIRVIRGAVLGLAGPSRKIAAMAAVTVIKPDDVADQILDRERNPQWQGERTRMVNRWSTDETLWLEYVELRKRLQREHDGAPEVVARMCNEFYQANRERMDAGSEVSWTERKEPDDISALQHAWNIRADRGDAAFMAEYQNDPLPDDLGDDSHLAIDDVCEKLNGYERGVVPAEATTMTAFIDVHEKALYWVVSAWTPNFTGFIVDYGAYPDQRSDYFQLREVKRTLKAAFPGHELEGALYAGLTALTTAIIGREWPRHGGGGFRIDKCMIDANWGQMTDLVYKFCRESPFAGSISPSHGMGITAAKKPLNDYQRKPGDRVGVNWRIPSSEGRAIRHVVFDANYWKTFIHTRLTTAAGDAGSLSIFGRSREKHRLLAEHICSEYRVKTEGRGRKVDEWQLRNKGDDNHLLDCLCGSAVAASIQGVALAASNTAQPKRKRVSFQELSAGRR